MKIELIKNDVVLAGPFNFDAARVTAIVSSHGENGTLVPAIFNNTMQIGSISLLRVIDDKPSHTKMERLQKSSRTVSATAVTYKYAVVPKSLESLKLGMLLALSAMHDRYEAATMEYNGAMLKVDLEARIAVKDVLDQFNAGTLTSTAWRGKAISNDVDMLGSGSTTTVLVPINSTADMQELYLAMQSYLAKGFIARGTVENSINTGTLTTLATLVLKTDWDAIVSA